MKILACALKNKIKNKNFLNDKKSLDLFFTRSSCMSREPMATAHETLIILNN